MKIFKEMENGNLSDSTSIMPKNTLMYRLAMAKVERGEAEIIPYTVDIEAERLKRRAFINAQRTYAISAGVEYNGLIYSTDAESRENLAAVYTGINDSYVLPEGFEWMTENNTKVPFTATDITELSHIILSHVNYQYQKSWLLKAAINAAETSDEINAIDWETVI